MPAPFLHPFAPALLGKGSSLSKKKKTLPTPPRSTPNSPIAGNSFGQDAQSKGSTSLLSPRLQRIVAGCATVHLIVIAFSYFASTAPSSFESRLLDFCRPYLALLHQDTEGLSLAIGRNLPAEKTHEMQVLASQTPDVETWDSELTKYAKSESKAGFLSPPVDNARGPAGGCRQRRWQRMLARMAELGELDQAALAAWFVTPLVEQLPDVEQVRIVRLPDLMTTVVDDSAAAPYSVAVVRSKKSPSLQLLQIPANRLIAPAVAPQASDNSDGDSP